jgi:uncharacterized caspase-like protein
MPNDRIALVIGNADYQHATALETPVNDALAMADALDRLGFQVRLAQNCDINDFQNELDNFSERIVGASAALFYYSGHALQYGGDNYLIPVDTRLEAARGLDRLTFRVTPQLEEMRSKAGVSLVFLDACRDNPFDLDPRGPAPGTKRVVVKPAGLAEIATEETKELKDALIAFAAEQGKTAADGEAGDLSPFTKALSEHIETSGLEVTKMMQRVKKSVREATKGKQTPWFNVSLTNEFFFNPTGGADPALGKLEATAGIEQPRMLVADTGGSGAKAFGEDVELESRVKDPQPDREVGGIAARLPNLAAGIESVARSVGPVLLGGLSMTIAFVLLLISQSLDLALVIIPESGKQVGFMAAPNWSIVYTLLFPFYLCLFAVLTDRVRITLTSLLRQKVIVDAEGRTVTAERLFAAWRAALQKVSLLLWCMLVIIVLQTSSEWFSTCLMPYFGGKVIAVDWTTSAIHGTGLERTKSIVFSCIAYLYMALALYVYLAILVYAATFCFFLTTLADPTGEFRLVLRDRSLGERFSDIGIIIYWSVILGLGAGFMMRLQAVYLESGYSIVTDLLLKDVLTWIGQPPAIGAYGNSGTATVPSAWTGLVEMLFTLLILFVSCLFLYNTFERAKQYYLDNIDNQKWREMMRIDHSKRQTEAIRRQPFLTTVFPMYIHFGVVVAGVAASGVFIGHGIIPLLTLAYIVLAFIIFPGFSGPHTDNGSEL